MTPPVLVPPVVVPPVVVPPVVVPPVVVSPIGVPPGAASGAAASAGAPRIGMSAPPGPPSTTGPGPTAAGVATLATSAIGNVAPGAVCGTAGVCANCWIACSGASSKTLPKARLPGATSSPNARAPALPLPLSLKSSVAPRSPGERPTKRCKASLVCARAVGIDVSV